MYLLVAPTWREAAKTLAAFDLDGSKWTTAGASSPMSGYRFDKIVVVQTGVIRQVLGDRFDDWLQGWVRTKLIPGSPDPVLL